MKHELIHKYLSGTCTRKEKEVVENWLNESPKNKKVMKELKQIWKINPGKKIEVDSLKAWEGFEKHVWENKPHDYGEAEDIPHIESGQPGKAVDKVRHRRWIYPKVITYAAAVAAVVLIAFMFTSTISFSTESTESELVSQEITTEKGQRTTVRLSDGTRIFLNAESRLSVPEDYMDINREVYLEGEAFFDVVSNQDKPFIVHTNRSVTRVLGTKFNVTAYLNKENVEVVVAEGKVALESNGELKAPEVQLTQNQRGLISKYGEIIASNVSDISVYTDWSRGKLTFRDTPLDEVEVRLERWYDIEVIVDDNISAKDRLLTGSFEDVPLSGVLNSIALSLDLKYKRDGQEVTFTVR